MPIFDHALPIIIKVTFSIPEFVWPCKKSVYSINYLLRYRKFVSLVTKVGTLIFDHTHYNIFKL